MCIGRTDPRFRTHILRAEGILSCRARRMLSSLENIQIPTKAMVIENSAGLSYANKERQLAERGDPHCPAEQYHRHRTEQPQAPAANRRRLVGQDLPAPSIVPQSNLTFRAHIEQH